MIEETIFTKVISIIMIRETKHKERERKKTKNVKER